MSDFDKATNCLIQMLARGQADAELLGAMNNMGQALSQYNFQGAMAVVKQLTSSHWGDHKEWLKPLKTCLELCKRNLRAQ